MSAPCYRFSMSHNDVTSKGGISHEGAKTFGMINNDERELRPIFTVPLILPLVWGTFRFAQEFPFVIWPKAIHYYIPAGYEYDATETYFDNSVWTYGTDYIIALFMAYGAWRCLTCEGGNRNASFRCIAAGILILYFISVLFGGFAHMHFTTLESLHTPFFRFVWTVCVGTVVMAGGFIGAFGSRLGKKFESCNIKALFRVPILPDYFWVCWSVVLTSICAMGGMSYKRPACDIFIAGTTQFIPTAYSIMVVFSRCWGHYGDDSHARNIQNIGTRSSSADVSELKNGIKQPSSRSAALSDKIDARIGWAKYLLKEIRLSDRILFYVGWVANCHLLPLYPILLHNELNLGLVNTMLHSNLLVAWGSQFFSMWHLCVVMAGLDLETNMVDGTKLSKYVQ